MKKLKSLDEFQQEGLQLTNEMLVRTNGSLAHEPNTVSEQYYYKDTTTPTSDCLRCSRVDYQGVLYEGPAYNCVYV